MLTSGVMFIFFGIVGPCFGVFLNITSVTPRYACTEDHGILATSDEAKNENNYQSKIISSN